MEISRFLKSVNFRQLFPKQQKNGNVYCLPMQIPMRNCPRSQTIRRSFSSYRCLFIEGDKKQAQCSILSPFFDFKNIFQNKRQEFEENLLARRMSIDLNQLHDVYEVFERLQEQKSRLESNKQTLVNKLKNDANNEQCMFHIRLIKNDLKALKETIWKVEANLCTQFLELPNFLHKLSPIKDDILIYDSTKVSENKNLECPAEVLQNDPNLIYYNHEFAILELELLYRIEETLLKKEFVEFNNADFCRTIVLEGAQLPSNDNKYPEIENDDNYNSLFLTGSASLLPFLAYFTKHFVHKSLMPLKLFSIGRKFSEKMAVTAAANSVSSPQDYFRQQSAIAFFILTSANETDLDNELFLILNQIIEIYENFGFDFRIVLKSAPNLSSNESLKISFEMFSHVLQSFLEIGSISVHDDFFSKRLLITTQESQFPKIISGQLVSIQKLFFCINDHKMLNKQFFK